MKMLQEFKEFAVKGNVIDLAVGVVIGAAFGKIVTSLVNDIVMPPIGYIIQGVDFEDLTFTMGGGEKPAEIKYGLFIQNTLHFLIIAFVILIVIKQFNKLKRKPQELPPSTKKCLYCKEPINVDATRCKFCTGEQAASPQPA
jgi:large conductance mechanosensitive channel